MRPGGWQATRSQRMDADSGRHSSKFPRWKVSVAYSADDRFWRILLQKSVETGGEA
jgi:hypothetical protein